MQKTCSTCNKSIFLYKSHIQALFIPIPFSLFLYIFVLQPRQRFVLCLCYSASFPYRPTQCFTKTRCELLLLNSLMNRTPFCYIRSITNLISTVERMKGHTAPLLSHLRAVLSCCCSVLGLQFSLVQFRHDCSNCSPRLLKGNNCYMFLPL